MADLPAIDRIASGGTVIDEPDASPPSVLDINATFGDEIIDKSEFIAEVHKSHALAMRARSHFPASPLSAVASKYEGGIDDTNAIFDARTSDQNKIEILMQPNIDSLFGDEYLTALTAPPPKALSDPSETLDGDATTTTAFEGEESTEAKNILSIVDDIFGSMPHELEELLRTNGQVAALPLARRRKRVRERLLTSSVGIVSNIRRAMKHLLKYLKENDLPFTCFANDVLIDSVEEYGDGAKTRAAQRKANATKHGKTLKRDRGGATARMPIVNGYANMSKLMGLPIEVSEELKDVARCGPGMPTVATMTSARAVRNYELKTMAKTGSAKNSKYVRAYAGGGCIKVYSSTRTKDLQRTPLISFEKSTVLGSDALIACGIARKSKAPAQKQMRPLAWRAPVISISGEDIDLQPLLESMPDSTDGCVFRDFITPPGVPPLDHPRDRMVQSPRVTRDHRALAARHRRRRRDRRALGPPLRARVRARPTHATPPPRAHRLLGGRKGGRRLDRRPGGLRSGGDPRAQAQDAHERDRVVRRPLLLQGRRARRARRHARDLPHRHARPDGHLGRRRARLDTRPDSRHHVGR